MLSRVTSLNGLAFIAAPSMSLLCRPLDPAYVRFNATIEQQAARTYEAYHHLAPVPDIPVPSYLSSGSSSDTDEQQAHRERGWSSDKATSSDGSNTTQLRGPRRTASAHAPVQRCTLYIRVFAPRPLWLPTTIRQRALTQNTSSSQLFNTRFNPSYLPMMNRMSSPWTLMNPRALLRRWFRLLPLQHQAHRQLRHLCLHHACPQLRAPVRRNSAQHEHDALRHCHWDHPRRLHHRAVHLHQQTLRRGALCAQDRRRKLFSIGLCVVLAVLGAH